MMQTTASSVPATVSLMDRWARDLLLRKLAGLRHGSITLDDAFGSTTLGRAADLRATLHVHRPTFYRHAVLGGTLAVAEAYLNGDWDSDDLTAMLRVFARNRTSADELDRGWSKWTSYLHRGYHWWRANTKAGSRENIAAHYDLGNDFYELWLDETMAYSSGIFPTPTASMKEASIAKFDRICRQLDLRPTDHVLEIGAGWGGFAVHAAREYGCRVTTTTISAAQFQFASDRIHAAGLADRVTLLQQDYRDLTGQFDKLVSIEMIEAVGHQYFDHWFRQCNDRLRPGGAMMVQAIVMPDQHYEQYLRQVDFIQRYIFPGGCLPSVGALLAAAGRASDLRLIEVSDFAPHYAETLRRWRQAFHRRLDDICALGHTERFLRLWHYYLCYCEAAFDEQCVGLAQMKFVKPGHH